MAQAELLTAPHRRSPPTWPPSRSYNSPSQASLKQGFAWLALGNIVNAACAWGRVAVLAHQGNSDVIGQLVLAWAICNPISSLFDLGLSSALISDVRGDFRLRDYISLRLITGLATLLAITVMVSLGGRGASYTLLVFMAGLVVVVESVCEIFQAQSQRSEAMQWVSLSLIVRGILGLGAFAIIHMLTGNLTLAVSGLAGAAIATLLAIDIPAALHSDRSSRVGRASSESHHDGLQKCSMHNVQCSMTCKAIVRSLINHCTLNLRSLLYLAWLSLPLGLAAASLDLATALPRYSISRQLGTSALGSFAVAGGLMVATSLVVGALGQAASPRLARHYADGDVDRFLALTTRLLLWVAAIGIAAAIGMAVVGKPLLHGLYGPHYRSLDRLAALLMVIAAVRNVGILLSRTLSSMRKFRLNLALRLVGLAVLAAMLPGWVACYGLWGAAWALGLSWLVTSLLALAAVLHVVKRREKDLGFRRSDPHFSSLAVMGLRGLDATPRPLNSAGV